MDMSSGLTTLIIVIKVERIDYCNLFELLEVLFYFENIRNITFTHICILSIAIPLEIIAKSFTSMLLSELVHAIC